MLGLAIAAGLVAVLGYGYRLFPMQTADAMSAVLLSGLALVIVAMVVMYWLVVFHHKRLRTRLGVDLVRESQPLTIWWRSAGWVSRLSGAIGVVSVVLGVGLVRSSPTWIGLLALAGGLLLLIVARLFAARRGAQ